MPVLVRAVLGFSAVLISSHVQAQQSEDKQQLAYTRSHYTKYEFQIPMRDGIKLFTVVYVPKDFSQPYPILMQRTPYSVSPYGIDNYRALIGPSEAAEKEG